MNTIQTKIINNKIPKDNADAQIDPEFLILFPGK